MTGSSRTGGTPGAVLSELTADLQGGVDRDGYRRKQLIGEDSILESRLNGEGRSLDGYAASRKEEKNCSPSTRARLACRTSSKAMCLRR